MRRGHVTQSNGVVVRKSSIRKLPNTFLGRLYLSSFTFEQVICGCPAVDAPSDTWTVATNSLPDEIKYLVQLYDEAPLSAH